MTLLLSGHEQKVPAYGSTISGCHQSSGFAQASYGCEQETTQVETNKVLEVLLDSGSRACQAGPEVAVQFLLVKIAANEDEFVLALLLCGPWLPHTLSTAPKGQQHVHSLEEIPAQHITHIRTYSYKFCIQAS